jgi:peptide/nickel transport system substrate-binding protein
MDPPNDQRGAHDAAAAADESRLTRRGLLAASATAGLALSASGFGVASAAAAETPKKGGHATFGISDGAPSDTLNPFLASNDDNMLTTAYTLYEALFQQNGRNVVVPWLATDAAPVKSNAKLWRVKLRPGVTFHDGRPFTADDVIWSFNFALDPKNKAAQLSNIDAIAQITKVSDHEVLFRLKRAIGDFKGLLVSPPALFIVPNGETSFNTTANGTGPFKLNSFSAGQRTELVRHDGYWGQVYLDQLTVVPIPDSVQRMNALLTGAADFIFAVDYASAKAHANDSKVQLITPLQSGIVPMYVQIDAPLFKDNRVRQALKMSVDRPQMIKIAQNGFGKIGNDVNGAGFPSYNTRLAQHHYDPEKAKSLLKAAGQSDLKFKLYTSGVAPGMLESATAWKAQSKAAGINIELVRVPSGNYYSNGKYLKVPAYQTAWGGLAFEVWAPQALFKSSPYNETHWYRPEWEAAFKKAQAIVNDAKRNAAYKDLQEPIWAEGGYILWGYHPTLNAASSRLQGVRPWSYLNYHPQDWWIK